jgi:D-aspartate ligase
LDNLSILILGGIATSRLVFSCLSRVRGIKIYVLSNTRDTILRYSRFCSSFTVYQNSDSVFALLDSISQIVKRNNVHVIMPVDLQMIRFAINQRKTLEDLTYLVHIPGADAFETVTDKWLFADFLMKSGLPHPKTASCLDYMASKRDIPKIDFPVLMKPRLGSGGQGIIYFDNDVALQGFLDSHNELCSQYIIQNYIHGQDFDCSVLCDDGRILALTVQRASIPGFHFAPARGIEFISRPDVVEVVSRLMSALKWNGIANIDLRYNELSNRVEIIELNPRYWGSLLGSLAAGVNFPYLACLAAQRIGFPRPQYKLIPYGDLRGPLGHRWLFRIRALCSRLWIDLNDPVPAAIRFGGKLKQKMKKFIESGHKSVH